MEKLIFSEGKQVINVPVSLDILADFMSEALILTDYLHERSLSNEFDSVAAGFVYKNLRMIFENSGTVDLLDSFMRQVERNG